jgi:hypothetical protein
MISYHNSRVLVCLLLWNELILSNAWTLKIGEGSGPWGPLPKFRQNSSKFR